MRRFLNRLSHGCILFVVVCIISLCALQTREDCALECKQGKVPFFRNAKHQFESNGCGTSQFAVHVPDDLKVCCDIHDALCGIPRNVCDEKFEKCLKKRCGRDNDCKSTATMLSMGTSMFGCQAFFDAQSSACMCIDKSTLNDKLLSVFRHIYIDSGKLASKSEAELRSLLEKWKGREAQLLLTLLEKYPKQLINVIRDTSIPRNEL
ncbi:hypothetical protein RFI_27710 [Reticulomyxa filosa]|uniref:Phospholipase A2 n=1 Tax=Reticulomyxa filosa TaxID=46433 RepID=X6M7N5_RETFI|nr:hypothetical protein RFI_27710 [Reticulomyxa filosa]|eukprot:ETO09666.1 hypothetical protein RFI_27710 [Reticulomyxa filosa]